jgi:hypothetical protein
MFYGTGPRQRKAIWVTSHKRTSLFCRGVSDEEKVLKHRRMEQRIYCIFIDYRGHHRKGVAN